MALKTLLRPQGPIAKAVEDIAKVGPLPKAVQMAEKALKEAVPDYAKVARSSALSRLVGRLAQAADQAIAGEAALGIIVHLHQQLLDRGLRLSTHDLARCLERALRLSTSREGRKFALVARGKLAAKRTQDIVQGYVNAFSGELRERVVQNLLEGRILVDRLHLDAQARALGSGRKMAVAIDSGKLGEVRLPTNPAKGAAPRADALGPDRLFGYIVPAPNVKKGDIVGELHVTGLVEIKARTGALGGLNQTQAFLARASHGEVLVHGKRYILKVDEANLKRVVILPEDAADKAEVLRFAKQHGIDVLPYSAKIEDEITAASQQAIGNLLQLDRLLR